MKKMFQIIAVALLIASCNKDDDGITSNNYPIVKSESTYAVVVEEDLTYAKGLSHDEFNGANTTKMDLKLDVYYPDNDIENRPLYFFIHGGGFNGGTKQKPEIVDYGNYYAARGWVFISIDYRVSGDFGTIPQEWMDYGLANVPAAGVGQYFAMYPAHRDAKAALRWAVANADTYKIDTDFITVGGASAGAITAITLGISEPEDFRDEINVNQDPTLSTTNLEQTYQIQTIVDYWGSKVTLDALEGVYGHQRFDSNDPSLFIAHGTEDPTVLFSNAEDLETNYETNGVPLAYYPAEGAGHGAWNVEFDNKRLEELVFDFLVEQQNLNVE